MRIAALVKQVPAFAEMTLGADGRLVRAGLDLEMNPYCRRAVAKAVELVGEHGGEVVVITLGPPSADDCLREAIAWADAAGVAASGVLVSDPAFAGSDTLATARALVAALELVGPFDLVLGGRNSVDSDTGQVGPAIAELLGWPFATGARHLSVIDGVVNARCEHDDGWAQLEFALPGVVSTAERLIDPCKVDPPGRAAVAADRIQVVTATALGAGPWGQAGSPTVVGTTRVHETARAGQRLAGPLEQQVADAVGLLAARGAFDVDIETAGAPLPPPAELGAGAGRTIGVVVEPDRAVMTAELGGTAARLAAGPAGSGNGTAAALGGNALPTDPGGNGSSANAPGPGRVVGLAFGDDDLAGLGRIGVDHAVRFTGALVEEDCAAAIIGWAREVQPWAVLLPSTAWGREVGGRVAAALGAGLTGDAVALELGDGDRLRAWKPAFGGQLVAAITATSPVQLVTVRPGMLDRFAPRDHTATVEERAAPARSRVTLLARTRDDDLDVLAAARRVIGIGQGVEPNRYDDLDPLLALLGAELAATRKVTDKGWLPHARQVGITGRSIAPRLFISIGASGKFNHMVGVRAAHTILAINPDPEAQVFTVSDIGIVGDWQEVLPLLTTALEPQLAPTTPTPAAPR